MPKKPPPLTEEALLELRRLAENGVSAQRLAIRFKRSQGAIRNIAAGFGVKLKTKTELRRYYGLSGSTSFDPSGPESYSQRS